MGSAFLFVWAGVLGLIWLLTRNGPAPMIRVPDLRWGLGFANLTYLFDPTDDNASLAIGIVLVNTSGAPISFHIENLEVKRDARALNTKSTTKKGGVVPSGVSRTYWGPAFPKTAVRDFLDHKGTWKIAFDVLYGLAQQPHSRRLKLEIEATATFCTDGAWSATDRIVSEAEVAI